MPQLNLAHHARLSAALILHLCALVACGDPAPSPAPMTTADMRADVPDAPDDATDDAPPTLPPDAVASRWVVQISPQAPEALQIAARDTTDALVAMGLMAELEQAEGASATCASGQGLVVLAGDGLSGAALAGSPDASDQQLMIREDHCEAGGRLVTLGGGGLLGRQYAVYEWLHALGVRFFHPEQEFTPPAPRWAAEPWERAHVPAFRWRSATLHLTHPLELGDVFREGKPEYADEGRRYIDWQIKNLASFGTTAAGPDDTEEYGVQRGFMRTAGFDLHNQQQGYQPIINPDDPRSEEEQLAAAIDAAMGDDPARYPGYFGFTFNPSEFTEIDDRDAVRQLTFIANYFEQNYPDTILSTINHGTAGAPTAHYGVRFYDLPAFAPANLGVRVHTLMFYDLFRPAPIYGNTSFRFLYDFMVEQYQTRSIWHYPESAWWLTFDNPIPLYLPITLEARDRDIQGIAFMLQGKLDGHRVFGSGHEWGYWQNEYCSYRMAFDLAYRYTDCIDDIASTAGPQAAPALANAVREVITLQERDIIYGDLLPYLVGSDPETEVAEAVGIVFHPLPPTPQQIMRWEAAEIARWHTRFAPQLERMDQDYARIVERLRQVQDEVPAGGRPWFDEILDGIEATGLRARHSLKIYGAAVAWREAQLSLDPQLRARAEALRAEASAVTQAVTAVVRRREGGYRYQPLSRSIAGGPEGQDDENWTIYRYRYHNRTHHAYYFHRPEQLLDEVMSATSQEIAIDDAILSPEQSLVLSVIDPELTDITVSFGDGQQAAGAMHTHRYDAPGIYTIEVTATRAGEPVTLRRRVAAVTDEQTTAFSGKILAPSGVDIIEPVMPGLTLGTLPDGKLALGFSAQESGAVPAELWDDLAVDAGAPSGALRSLPSDVLVPVINRSTAAVVTTLIISGGVVSQDAARSPITITGALPTQSVIDAVVAVGGFEPRGARRIVSQLLGYTADTLPDEVPFEVSYTPTP